MSVDAHIADGIAVELEHDDREDGKKEMTIAFNEEHQTTNNLAKIYVARSTHSTQFERKAAEIEEEAALREAELKAEEEASLAAFRAALELKRQKAREAQLAHEETVVRAVCAASLLEFTERERIEAQMALDEKKRLEDEAAQLENIAALTTAAKLSKTIAVQSVLDLKAKAYQAKLQAQKAIQEYEMKERERQEKLAALSDLESQRELELQLGAMKQRQEAATLKRQESERRALEAKERAQALRQSALDAAKHMRETTKLGISAILESEEKVREAHYASELQTVQGAKEEARRRREESERRATEAAQRAAALREKAVNAAKDLRSISKRGIEAVLEKEELLRHQQFQSQMSAVQSEREEATRMREECEQRAIAAAERAKTMASQISLSTPQSTLTLATTDTTEHTSLSPAIDIAARATLDDTIIPENIESPTARKDAPAAEVVAPSSAPLPAGRAKKERKKKCVIM